MNTIRALLYADARSIVNQMHEIRRRPARAVLWALWIIVLGAFIVFRMVAPFGRRGGTIPFSAVAQTDLIVCGGLVWLGLTLISGKMMTGLFAHVAEARFIIGSPASPIVATLYIQFREILRRGARLILTSGYLILVYLPRSVAAPAIARDLLYILAGMIALASVPLPRRLVRGWALTGAIALGYACIAAAIVPIARDAAVLFPLPPRVTTLLTRLPEWHPGDALTEPIGAHSLLIFAGFIAIAAAAFFVLARTARDAYPELYAFSLERLSRVERLRKRRLGVSAQAGTAGPSTAPSRDENAHVPAGPAVFIWRAWTNYRRSNSPRSTAIETGICLIAGFLIGRFEGDNIDLLASVAFSLANVLLIFAINAAVRIGAELRKPLFWLSSATLFERLCALALADSWRVIAWCALLGIGLVSGHALPGVAITALLVAPAGIFLAVSVGYALFALLPNDIDQRGPLAIVRWLLSYVLAAPAAAVGVTSGVVFGSAILGLLVTAASALVEAAVLIGFASWRLDRAAALPRRNSA